MKKAAILSFLMLAIVPALQAHHAPAVFDQTRTIVVEGVVTEFVWSNPHSWIRMDVTADDGTVTNWSMEMNPPTYLVRGGWRSSTLKPGDRVRVVCNPLRTRRPQNLPSPLNRITIRMNRPTRTMAVMPLS